MQNKEGLDPNDTLMPKLDFAWTYENGIASMQDEQLSHLYRYGISSKWTFSDSTKSYG